VKGRSKRDGAHVRTYVFDMERPSWRTLSAGARALLIELKALYHGANNGELYLSVREAARRLNADKSTVSEWFWQLQDRGWIRPKVEAGFNWKTAARARMATCWRLTEFPTPGGSPTREFATWEGPPQPRPKKIRRSAYTDRLSAHTDSLSAYTDRAPKSVRPHGQNRPKPPQKAPALSVQPDTDNYHGGGEGEQCSDAAASGAVSSGPGSAAAADADLPRDARPRPATPKARRRARAPP
jgi:hypothetical protein